jgi:hypothetical protein
VPVKTPKKPDWVFFLIRYQVRGPRGAKKEWCWTDTGRLREQDARKLYADWTRPDSKNKNMRNFQLVMSCEYVIDEPRLYIK